MAGNGLGKSEKRKRSAATACFGLLCVAGDFGRGRYQLQLCAGMEANYTGRPGCTGAGSLRNVHATPFSG